MGSVRIPKLSLELDNRPHEQWFPLRAPSAKRGMCARPRPRQAGRLIRAFGGGGRIWHAGDDQPESPSGTDVTTSTSTDASESKKHDFRPYSFTAPVFCDQCRGLVWGAKRHGLQCDYCGFSCHKECEGSCRPTCGTVGAIRMRYRYTEEYILPLPIYGRLLEVAPGLASLSTRTLLRAHTRRAGSFSWRRSSRWWRRMGAQRTTATRRRRRSCASPTTRPTWCRS
jgi:hypothetical protein